MHLGSENRINKLRDNFDNIEKEIVKEILNSAGSAADFDVETRVEEKFKEYEDDVDNVKTEYNRIIKSIFNLKQELIYIITEINNTNLYRYFTNFNKTRQGFENIDDIIGQKNIESIIAKLKSENNRLYLDCVEESTRSKFGEKEIKTESTQEVLELFFLNSKMFRNFWYQIAAGFDNIPENSIGPNQLKNDQSKEFGVKNQKDFYLFQFIVGLDEFKCNYDKLLQELTDPINAIDIFDKESKKKKSGTTLTIHLTSTTKCLKYSSSLL